jgi:putative NADH-flavin reductase
MSTSTNPSLKVFGGAGWVGRALVAEAAARGHSVVDGGRVGSDHGVSDRADAIVVAVPGAVQALIAQATREGSRLAVVGGSGSLLTADGGPRLMDAHDFRPEWLPEARAHAAALEVLRSAPAGLDWFCLSPPAAFGPWTGAVATRAYRTGADVVLRGADGTSVISEADYALAFVDELERPLHSRRRFTVAR